MNPKQKLKSISNKMKRIKENNTEIDFVLASRYFHDIKRYYELRQEHFHLQFEIEHCKTCGKKI